MRSGGHIDEDMVVKRADATLTIEIKQDSSSLTSNEGGSTILQVTPPAVSVTYAVWMPIFQEIKLVKWINKKKTSSLRVNLLRYWIVRVVMAALIVHLSLMC